MAQFVRGIESDFIRPWSSRQMKLMKLDMSIVGGEVKWRVFVIFLHRGRLDKQDQRRPSTGFASEGIFKPLACQRDQGNGQCSLTTAEDD